MHAASAVVFFHNNEPRAVIGFYNLACSLYLILELLSKQRWTPGMSGGLIFFLSHRKISCQNKSEVDVGLKGQGDDERRPLLEESRGNRS